MPAAAVIPAPIAYANAVAVKKLVVGFWVCGCSQPCSRRWFPPAFGCGGSNWLR